MMGAATFANLTHFRKPRGSPTMKSTSEPLPARSKPRRRWFRFSLRTLLILVLVIAAFFGGWTANEWKRQRELQQARQETEDRLKEELAAMRVEFEQLVNTGIDPHRLKLFSDRIRYLEKSVEQ